MKATLPLLIASPFILIACTNPADKAVEMAEQSKNPQLCVDALLSILEEATESEDTQKAKERVDRLKSVISNFNTTDTVIFLSLLKEPNTLKKLQTLDSELAKKKIVLPSIFQGGK